MYNIPAPNVETFVYGILSTATELTDLSGTVTFTSPDENGDAQEYPVSIGAVIFDASVPLVEEESEEEDEEEGAYLNSIKWGALTLSTFMLAQ